MRRHHRSGVFSYPLTSWVRIQVSPGGEFLEVEPIQGNAALLDRVIDSLAETTFDPALINGEPVRGELDLVFVFPSDP